MKKVLIILILLSLSLSMSCERRLFQFVGTIQKHVRFEIHDSAAFDATAFVSGSEIRDAANIPDDGVIREVSIEGIYLMLDDPGAYNTATGITVNAYIKKAGGSKIYVYKDPINLTQVGIPIYGANAWLFTAISEMMDSVNNYLQGVQEPDLEVHIEGNPDPAGSTTHIVVLFGIQISVKYDQCVETMGIFGEKCNL